MGLLVPFAHALFDHFVGRTTPSPSAVPSPARPATPTPGSENPEDEEQEKDGEEREEKATMPTVWASEAVHGNHDRSGFRVVSGDLGRNRPVVEPGPVGDVDSDANNHGYEQDRQ